MAIDMLKIQPECVISAMVIALLVVLSIGMEMHRPSRMRTIRVAMLLLLLPSSFSIVERDEAGRSHDAVIKWADSCNAPKIK